jgi:hypothetical protein
MFPGSLQLGKWRIRGTEPGAFILERFDDDGAIQSDAWRTVASFGHNADTNVNRLSVDNLSVGGVDIMQGFANVEPAFSVEAPLEKDFNLATGITTLRVDTTGLGGNPVFCGGRIDGATATQVSSIGRVGYTVSRPSGQATGIWTVTFNSPAANINYSVQLTNMHFGTIYLWDQMPPTAQGFTVVCVNNTWNLRNATFHFTVFG